jgi:hypothetical protein
MPGQKVSVYENGSLKKRAGAEHAVSSRQQVPRETHKQELHVSDNEGFLNQKLNGRLTVQSGQGITIPADGDIIKLNQKDAFEAQGHSRIIENSPGLTGKGYHHTETILQSPQSNLAETYLPDEDLKYTLEFNPQIN